MAGRNKDGGRKRRPAMRAWRDAADEGLRRAISAGRRDGPRRALARLQLGEASATGVGEIAAAVRERLERALEAERRRGRARRWTYDFNRHLALLQALAALDDEAGPSEGPGQDKSAARDADGA